LRGQSGGVVIHTRGVFIVTSVFAWVVASAAQAEPLPGRFEATGGAHVLVLGKRRCEADGDVVGCSGPWLFADLDAAAHAQVIPWLALGLRLAGGKDFGDGTQVDGDASTRERDTWLWRGSVEARFDPPLWPRAIWIAAELGGVVAVATAETVSAQGNTIESSSTSTFGFLAGLGAGWDFSIYEGLLLGFEARLQVLTIEKLGTPPTVTGKIDIGSFPYVSIGLHAGYRW
jgi:hypothetical protein